MTTVSSTSSNSSSTIATTSNRSLAVERALEIGLKRVDRAKYGIEDEDIELIREGVMALEQENKTLTRKYIWTHEPFDRLPPIYSPNPKFDHHPPLFSYGVALPLSQVTERAYQLKINNFETYKQTGRIPQGFLTYLKEKFSFRGKERLSWDMPPTKEGHRMICFIICTNYRVNFSDDRIKEVKEELETLFGKKAKWYVNTLNGESLEEDYSVDLVKFVKQCVSMVMSLEDEESQPPTSNEP